MRSRSNWRSRVESQPWPRAQLRLRGACATVDDAQLRLRLRQDSAPFGKCEVCERPADPGPAYVPASHFDAAGAPAFEPREQC
jgi:hypothetical protein